VRSLEDRIPPAPDGGEFVVDIGGPSDAPPRYWIDGREVGWHEFERRAPRADFVVDIGGDDDTP
jgi:hypothetical protein